MSLITLFDCPQLRRFLEAEGRQPLLIKKAKMPPWAGYRMLFSGLLFALIATMPSIASAVEDPCSTWSKALDQAFDDGLTAMNMGQYPRAVFYFKQGLAQKTTCESADVKWSKYWIPRAQTEQYLLSALLAMRDYGRAANVAKNLSRDLEGDGLAVNRDVLAGDYRAAFKIYQGILGDDNSISIPTAEFFDEFKQDYHDAGLMAMKKGVAQGAAGKLLEANQTLSGQLIPGSQTWEYLAGISALSVGKRCEAYRAFRDALTAGYLSTQAYTSVNAPSLGAIGLLDALYLSSEHASAKVILAGCD